MTQYVMGPDNMVQMLPDGEATDPISVSLKQSGIYQSPDGWAIVTGSPGGQLGGAPRIILDTNGKQPPADVLARFPMAPPQEIQGFQQQAAQYRAGEGKPVSLGQAALAAVASYFGAQALGGLAGGAGAAGGASTLGDLTATDLGGGYGSIGGVNGSVGGAITGAAPAATGSNLGALAAGAGGAFDMGGTAGALGEGASGVDGVQAGIDAANSGSDYSLRGITDAESGLGGLGTAAAGAAGAASAAAKGTALSRILDGTAKNEG